MKTMFRVLQEIQQGKASFSTTSENDAELPQIVTLLKEAEKQGLLGKVLVLEDPDGGVLRPIEATVSRGLTHGGEQFLDEHVELPAAAL